MSDLRTAGPQDIFNISALLADSWKTAYRGIISDSYLDAITKDHWTEFLNAGLHKGTVFALVMELNYEIIGAAILAPADEQAETSIETLAGTPPKTSGEVHLVSFYLHPEKIGQGYGHQFYTAVEQELRKRNYSVCVLDVLAENTRAIRFYEGHGFREMEEMTETWLGEESYLCKMFCKDLT